MNLIDSLKHVKSREIAPGLPLFCSKKVIIKLLKSLMHTRRLEMKKLFLIFALGSLIIVSAKCFAANNESSSNGYTTPAFVMCTENNRTCTIGEYTLTGSLTHPLYVRDGIVCTHDRKICSNGFQQIISSASQPVYIAEDSSDSGSARFIMCTSNKKLCALGKYTMRGSDSQPLYIGNGVLCTANRKKCTNGYKIMRSSTPMY